MSTVLTQDRILLRDQARELAQGQISARAAEVDRTEEYPWDHVEAMKDSGFLGMTIPEAYGGKGKDWLDAVLVIEEMAKACSIAGRIAVETNMGAVSEIGRAHV